MAAKNKFMNAMKMPAIADMFSSEADRQRESGDLVTEVPLSELHPFVNHPFEVRDDEDMQKLVDSIKENGVLTNLTVRPRAEGGYEIISGHRRFHAAQLAGLDKIKVQVRDVDDDQAIIDMVDANIQREHISPMEKARAYAMKLEAICWMNWGTKLCSLPATVLQFRLNQCIIQILNHPHKRPVERRLSQMMYTNVKGYQIPNLSLPKAKITNLNRYGRMRLDYLEQNEPNLCDQMMLEGTLLPSCRKMGLDAQQMVDKTLHDLMQKAQMPDRKTNPLGWAQMCNSLKQQAEEMILPMLYEV